MSADDRGSAPTDGPTTTSGADDQRWLRRCVELASTASDVGDDPFGSMSVDGTVTLVAEATGQPGWGLTAADLLVRSGRDIEVVGPDPAFHDGLVALHLGG